MERSSHNIRKFLILSGPKPQNISLKKFIIFFHKKICSENDYFLKRNFSSFQEAEHSYIFLNIVKHLRCNVLQIIYLANF